MLLLVACAADTNSSPTEPEQPSFDEAILGTWEMIELEVEAPTYADTDTTFRQHIQEADWARVYGVAPGRTTFSADGKLIRRNRLVGNDSPMLTHGLWRFENDSLLIIEPNTTQFFVPEMNATQDQLEVKGQIDWDNDGELDDRYRARYRLVGKTQEAEN
ncbi:MAG: hypothetical protein AAF433_11320 [Bacteroidota bacterium]